MRNTFACRLMRRLQLWGFQIPKNRVWNRVQGWMEQTLSAGGKDVLIKAVAQAVPTFFMSCFKLPIEGAVS